MTQPEERMPRKERTSARIRSKSPRIFAVEMLRLLAIVGIAIFHTFLPAFESVLGYGPWPTVPNVPISAVTGTLWAVWLVMMIKFVGAWGNHIFFMISGYFLIPRMMRDSLEPGYWRKQAVSTARRVAQVLATVAFYTLIMLAVDRFVAPVASAGWKEWFLLGLEFIWIYTLVVALAPAAAWLLARVARWNATVLVALAAVAMMLVYALNAYVAFTSTGSFALLDWRKWMGVLSYAVSFMLAGLVGHAIRRARGVVAGDGREGVGYGREAGREKSGRPLWMRAGVWAWTLAAVLAVLSAVVAWAVAKGDYPLMYRLSFKSTSAFSFVLAVCSLMIAVTRGRSDDVRDDGVRDATTALPAAAPSHFHNAVQALASGILGFYVVQSLAGGLWKPLCERAMAPALANAALVGGQAARFGWLIVWFAIGIAFSVAFVAVVCVCDRCIRQPLLRVLKLSR
jgi:peptidoglycan/LPS O-acetylase OafA/YrhL